MTDTLDRPIVRPAPRASVAPPDRVAALASGPRITLAPMPADEARRRLERLAGVADASAPAVGN